MTEPQSKAVDIIELQAQLAEARQTLEAIRSGDVDSLIIGLPGEERVYSLVSADRAYRLMVETMPVGVATVSSRGIVMYANSFLEGMLGLDTTAVVGSRLHELFHEQDAAAVVALWKATSSTAHSAEALARIRSGAPARLEASAFDLDGTRVSCVIAYPPGPAAHRIGV